MKLVFIQKAVDLVTDVHNLIMDTGVDENVHAELLKGLTILFVSSAESMKDIYYMYNI